MPLFMSAVDGRITKGMQRQSRKIIKQDGKISGELQATGREIESHRALRHVHCHVLFILVLSTPVDFESSGLTYWY